MEETNQTSSSKAFLPMALGAVGLAIGIAALIVAINASNKASSIVGDFQEKIDKAAKLSVDMKEINEKLANITTQFDDLKSSSNSRFDGLLRNVQTAVNNLEKGITENRQYIDQNRDAIKELASRGTRPAAAVRTSSNEPASTTDASGAAAPAASGKKYTIKSGDILSKIAQKQGCSLSALEAANPGIDPKRLHIGQEINLP